jgi:EAL domain-containing protein (putative c-di-GMP-specific phosphodiesterase class I)
LLDHRTRTGITLERFMTPQPHDLERALARGELLFHYQPKVSFLTGRIAGAEALIRWNHPDGPTVRAADFMPAAAASGLGAEITRQMFPRLVEDLRSIRECRGDTHVAFNVAADDLGDAALVGMIRHAISDDALDAGCLEIEVTEGTEVQETPAVARSLTGLLAAGVSLSMDDYGIGFSSLEALSRLPFSVLKMDQSFVLRMLSSPKSATLVKTSIATAHLLGLRTVVEGIERQDVYRALLHYGCDEGQGYWLSPPLPLEEYVAFLRSDPRWPSSPIGMLRMAQLTHTWQLKLLFDLIHGYLKSPESTTGVPPGLHIGHDQCALGLWFNGSGRALAGDPAFDGLEAPHHALHDLCGELVASMEQPDGRRRVRELLVELSERASELGAALQRLETKLLLADLD